MNKQEIEKAISLLKSDIGVLDNYLKKHPLVISHYLEEDRCFENQLIKDMEFTISALEKQLNNGWIPVSERLPEKSGVYLATFLEEGKRYVERFYYSDFTGWMMPVAWQDEGRIDEIIAWQPLPEPLPEPYKELATDNNVVTKSGKDNNALTIGDKIRESNESLAEYISKFTILADRQRIIDYLNQPYMK